jgi:protein SCO1/2
MMLRLLLIPIALLALCLPGLATSPPNLSGLEYKQRPGAMVPLDATLKDESGNGVRLASFINGKPVILALVYFRCPNICGVVQADLFGSLRTSGLRPGRDYSLMAISIDPSETNADATAAKKEALQRYSVVGAEQNWHFLTASDAAIRAIADAVGFGYRFDEELKQFIHPAGVVFLTASGTVSNYLLGVGYEPADLRLAVTRAERGTVASSAMPILLLCFHYDPETGRYSLAITKLLRLFAFLTAMTIAVTLFLAFRRERGHR